MSSFEKAGVLFITGLVAVILALALFGTSGSTEKLPETGGGADVANRDADSSTVDVDPGTDGSREAEEDMWTGPQGRAEEILGGRPNDGGGAAAPIDAGSESRPPSGSRQHVVRSGDRLANIAKQYLGDSNLWKSIADANPGIDPSRLRVGHKLAIPDRGASPTAPPAADRVPASEPKVVAAQKKPTYVVKKGDTLTSIAQRELRNGAAWRRLYDMNKHVVKNANRLPVGVTLTLPAN